MGVFLVLAALGIMVMFKAVISWSNDKWSVWPVLASMLYTSLMLVGYFFTQ
jgi:hypothetical protein